MARGPKEGGKWIRENAGRLLTEADWMVKEGLVHASLSSVSLDLGKSFMLLLSCHHSRIGGTGADFVSISDFENI